MSVTSAGPSTTSPPRTSPPKASLGRVTAAGFAGTVIEQYDFLLYGFMSALVFGVLFFPSADPTAGTLVSFAAFAIGFVARPIGAIVAGHYGDRIGRKKVLVTTLLVAGVATTLMGFLPAYADIGVWAPILLVALRLVQGFSYGGEITGAVLITTESAPRHRRGYYGGFISAAGFAGLLLATAAILTVSGMDRAAFLSWGWRIPFLLSIVLVVVGLVIRVGVPETPAFAAAHTRHRAPLLEVFRRHTRQVLLGVGTGFGFYVTFYVLLVFSASYLTVQLKLPARVPLVAVAIGSVVALAVSPLCGRLCDRFGRRPMLVTGSGFMAAFSFGFFRMLDSGDASLIYLAYALAFGGVMIMFSPLLTFIAEQFPTGVRYSGSSMAGQLGAVLGGGLAPLVATALLTASGGRSVSVAAYVCVAMLVTLVSALALRETNQADITGD
ncbi:MFS transporter [Sphaerisporangium siamense]|uniref:MFS family permease n=1 Tax=Sphaerisporangium siamense TaxID=795645 RepID=A0A7W7D1U4_9ACTN|nr:MFS transporter [Sphaerisporangium siamense]MBB4698759.1 MFS family permease [Sphaerisporangium siamense]